MERINLGLINIMPNAFNYQKLLMKSISGVSHEVQLHPMKLVDHVYSSSSEMMDSSPSFWQVIDKTSLDLLILTGSPVEHLEFSQITYWRELCKVLDFASNNITSTLGICFGGLAIAKFLGIEKRISQQKHFGVLPFTSSGKNTALIGSKFSEFYMPVSTWARIDDESLKLKLNESVVSLAHNDEMGHGVLETKDKRFLMMMAHPEYSLETLEKEWVRDSDKSVPYALNLTESDFCQYKRYMEVASPNFFVNWINQHFKVSKRASLSCEII